MKQAIKRSNIVVDNPTSQIKHLAARSFLPLLRSLIDFLAGDLLNSEGAGRGEESLASLSRSRIVSLSKCEAAAVQSPLYDSISL